MKLRFAGWMVLCAGVAAVGCSESTPPAPQPAPAAGAAATSPKADYLLTEAPASPLNVANARKDSVNETEITVRGRVGGEEKPFVDGLAAFTIVDTKLKPCEEGCATPWDYCCSTDELPTHKALVKFVDSSGKAVAGDARTLLGVKELSFVVVQGRAKRDEAGNLTVLADKIFVEKQP